MSSVVIAIDGPAASGKGTLAARLARHFGYAHLESGLLYRAAALEIRRKGLDPADREAAADVARSLSKIDAKDGALRDEETGNVAGMIAAYPEVRAALVAFQRDFAESPPNGAPGAVIDGRDIGTVICPEADRKIYVDATPEERANRRLKELQARGVASIPSRVLQDMTERDARDRERATAPLVPADDAYVLDTTSLSADDVFDLAVAFITTQNKPNKLS